MNILFIASLHHNFCGGEVCTLRNLRIIQNACPDNQVTEIRISRNNEMKRDHPLLWYMQGLVNDIYQCSISGIDKKQLQNIHYIIQQKAIDLVFIDKSILGLLAKSLRRQYPSIKIVTFFHNIEYLYYKKELDINGKRMLRYRLPIILKNEKAACQYSDAIITLNKRDNELLKKLYGRAADYTLPITLEDRYSPQQTSQIKDECTTRILFVGSYFSMNIEGLRHFIQHILPHTKALLTIAGSGMKQLEPEFGNNPQITWFDYVPDLTQLYEEASFVIIPIYSGSGMKVKTAEALMYGKYIIGTPEAFTGYDISHDAGIQCNTDQEFIHAINTCKHQGYNPASRELFLQKYSNECCYSTIKSIFEK